MDHEQYTCMNEGGCGLNGLWTIHMYEWGWMWIERTMNNTRAWMKVNVDWTCHEQYTCMNEGGCGLNSPWTSTYVRKKAWWVWAPCFYSFCGLNRSWSVHVREWSGKKLFKIHDYWLDAEWRASHQTFWGFHYLAQSSQSWSLGHEELRFS